MPNTDFYVQNIRYWAHESDKRLDGAIATLLLDPTSHVEREPGDGAAYAAARGYLLGLLRDDSLRNAFVTRYVKLHARWPDGDFYWPRLPAKSPYFIVGRKFEIEQGDYTRELLRAYVHVIERYEGLVKHLDAMHPATARQHPAAALRRLRECRLQTLGALDVVGSPDLAHMVWIREVHTQNWALHTHMPAAVERLDTRAVLLDLLVDREVDLARER